MFVVDLEKKVAHDLSRPQYECHIGKIKAENKKKIYTQDGLKRFLEDPLNKEYKACQFCLPDMYEFDMTKIFS